MSGSFSDGPFAPDTPMPARERISLSVDEATAIVSAAFAEDHDVATLDTAIKRLGDFVDAGLGLRVADEVGGRET